MMRFAWTSCLSAALLLLAIRLAYAQDADSAASAANKPYASIVARNMFGLLPIPPPDTNPPAPPVDPPPKITPNGIMTIFGRDQALFKVANKPKAGQPAKEDSYVLAEGERQDDIEVQKIDKENAMITFDNHGTIQELPLVDANAGGSPGGGGPGGGHGSALGEQLPGFMRGNSPAERAAVMRERQSRGGMPPGSPGFNPSAGTAQPSASTALSSAGTMQSSAGSSSMYYQQPSAQQPGNNNIEDQVMDTARQMALIEQNRIATQDAVEQGLMPPLPPTRMTPSDATGFGGLPLSVPPSDDAPPGAMPPQPVRK